MSSITPSPANNEPGLFKQKLTEKTKANPPVAQVANLPYRGLAIRRRPPASRLPGDTADQEQFH